MYGPTKRLLNMACWSPKDSDIRFSIATNSQLPPAWTRRSTTAPPTIGSMVEFGPWGAQMVRLSKSVRAVSIWSMWV